MLKIHGISFIQDSQNFFSFFSIFSEIKIKNQFFLSQTIFKQNKENSNNRKHLSNYKLNKIKQKYLNNKKKKTESNK